MKIELKNDLSLLEIQGCLKVLLDLMKDYETAEEFRQSAQSLAARADWPEFTNVE